MSETRKTLSGWILNRVGVVLLTLALLVRYLTRFKDKYKTLCTIRADVSNVPVFPLKRSPIHFTQAESVRPFYRQKFWVVLSFGMAEMKAEVKWFEGVSAICLCQRIILAHQHRRGRMKRGGKVSPSGFQQCSLITLSQECGKYYV
jgi:hypothetical protein